MTFRQARELFDYWSESPPEHELMALFARVYTTWEPVHTAAQSEEELRVQHRKSLEARWSAGAMSAKDLFEMGGGIGQ